MRTFTRYDSSYLIIHHIQLKLTEIQLIIEKLSKNIKFEIKILIMLFVEIYRMQDKQDNHVPYQERKKIGYDPGGTKN